jgi:hypothetical protein
LEALNIIARTVLCGFYENSTLIFRPHKIYAGIRIFYMRATLVNKDNAVVISWQSVIYRTDTTLRASARPQINPVYKYTGFYLCGLSGFKLAGLTVKMKERNRWTVGYGL